MVNINTLCLGCMSDKGNNKVCSHCGDIAVKQSNSIALPYRTVLNKRFLIGRVLGRPGGFGITYLAWDMLLETTAAIKEFLPMSSVSREPGTVTVRANTQHDHDFFTQGLRIFLKEAKTLAQFSHPNIVRIRDCFPANNTAYLVMEYHQGKPLDQVIAEQGGCLTEDKALEIMLPILDGLDAVHKKGFLHRDIKPQNIYLTAKGIPVLLDFGASRFALADSTQTLTVMLSAGYAPFEQYHQKGKQGPWTDIYSCGATLYTMVTGKKPEDAIERQHEDKLLSPVRLNPQLSEDFSAALMQALSPDARGRPHSVAALRKILIGTSYNTVHPMQTGNDVAVPRPQRPETKQTRQPVVIQYDNRRNGSGLGRVLWYAGLAAVLWFSWSTRQLLETGNNAFPPPLETVEMLDDGTIIVTEQLAPVDYIELVEQIPPEAFFDESPPDPYYDQQPIVADVSPQQVIPQPLQPVPKNAMPSDPAKIACYNKVPHSPCSFAAPDGNLLQGLCLPGHLGYLNCFHKPPPRHSPPSRPPPYGVPR